MNLFKKIFSVLFILYSSLCFAQNLEINRLKTYIEKSKDDSTKVDSLIELSKLFSEKNPESTIHFANLAKNLAQKINYSRGIAKSLKVIGNVYAFKGIYIEAINFWDEAIIIYDSIGDKKGVANILSNNGAIFFDQQEDSMACEYYLKALKIAEEIQDTLRIAVTLHNIASVYSNNIKTHERAKEFYHKALLYEVRIKDSIDRSDLIGTSSEGLGQYYFERDSAKIETNPEALDSAIFYTEKSLKSREGTLDEPYTLNRLGLMYLKKKDYEKAIHYQKKAVESSRKNESKDDLAFSLVALAQVYLKKGENKLALQTFKEAEKIAKETNVIYSLRDIYDGQAKIYFGLHDFKNYYNYQNLLLGIIDSVYKIQVDKRTESSKFIKKIDKFYQTKLSNKEKRIQEERIDGQIRIRNIFIGGFIIVLIFAGLFLFQRNKISKEKERSEELLLNILPAETAEELKTSGSAKAKSFDSVTVMFTDFKDFTKVSENMSAEELIREINFCYSEFDKIISSHRVEKIKTIGDSYMSAAGLPVENKTNPVDTIKAALEILMFMDQYNDERSLKNKPVFEIRIGIHTGPVVAGIVGIKKFSYDIWGDTVNIASRIESKGEVGKVNISGSTFELVKDKFNITYRGKIEAKNKGMIDMYFVDSVI